MGLITYSWGLRAGCPSPHHPPTTAPFPPFMKNQVTLSPWHRFPLWLPSKGSSWIPSRPLQGLGAASPQGDLTTPTGLEGHERWPQGLVSARLPGLRGLLPIHYSGPQIILRSRQGSYWILLSFCFHLKTAAFQKWSFGRGSPAALQRRCSEARSDHPQSIY